MSEMKTYFAELLGITKKPATLRFPRIADIKGSRFAEDIETVFRELGGISPQIPSTLGGWDMEFEGATVLLDGYLHFNRYRATTLKSPLYSHLPSFPLRQWQEYCASQEDRCLTAGAYGGKWSNPSCEKQFGPSGPPKDLQHPGGAARWKQRAFYDFLKDLSPLLVGTKVVRISFWDVVPGSVPDLKVEEVLKGRRSQYAENLRALVRSRRER